MSKSTTLEERQEILTLAQSGLTNKEITEQVVGRNLR
jgi:DNA-binding NarL/FixJ family response regulator